MSVLIADLRYASRILRRSPGLTLAALAALALGIGATSAIFSVVDAVLLRPLPFADVDRLVMVFATRPPDAERNQLSAGNFVDLRAQARTLEHVGAYSWWDVNLTGVDEPERLQGFLVSPDFFDALGVRPLLGRTLRPEEEQPGKDGVVLLSQGLWERRFGGDPAILGAKLILNGAPLTVIGVMPASFAYPPGKPEVWAPLTIDPLVPASRTSHSVKVIARLAPGVERKQAQAEIEQIAAALDRAAPQANAGWGLAVHPLLDDVVHYSRPVLWPLFGGVVFVLLIACANVANLLLARGATRRTELAIRAAVGASRARVFRQLMTESLLLSFVGGALGLVVAVWGTELICSGLPADIVRFVPGWERVSVDLRTVAFTAAACLVTGILFGIAPALRASSDLGDSLKETSRGGGRRTRLRGALVVSEVALAIVLLVGAGLSIRGFLTLVQENLGLRADGLLTAQVNLGSAEYDSREKVAAFYRDVLDRVAGLPGATAAAAASNLPFSGEWETRRITIEGAAPVPPDGDTTADFCAVSARYFEVLGMPVTAGRTFVEGDDERAEPVAIVSGKLARRTWPDQDPIGRRIKLGRADSISPWRTVVGVVGDVRRFGLEPEGAPTLYVPYPQEPRSGMTVIARTPRDPTLLAGPMRAAVRTVSNDQPLFAVRPMERVIADAIAGPRLTMGLMGALALLALLLAAVGIYAVASHGTAQRTHEIGVRMALGAVGADVVRLVLGQTLKLVLLGLALGIAGAVAVSRALAGALFWLRPSDATAFVALPLLLLAIALVSSWLPARKATRVDPTVALRSE